jgi:hypothetical protein
MRNLHWRMLYGWKLMLSSYLFVSLLLALSIAVTLFFMETWQVASAELNSIMIFLCVVAPVFTIVLFANLLAEDFEQQVFPLTFTYSEPSLLILIERVIVGVLILFVFWSTLLWIADARIMDLSNEEFTFIMKAAVPTHLFFAGLALLVSIVGRGVLAGLAVGVGYWLADFTSRGTYTGELYIFQSIWPNKDVSDLNSIWIYIASAAFFTMAMLSFAYAKRWIAGK